MQARMNNPAQILPDVVPAIQALQTAILFSKCGRMDGSPDPRSSPRRTGDCAVLATPPRRRTRPAIVDRRAILGNVFDRGDRIGSWPRCRARSNCSRTPPG